MLEIVLNQENRPSKTNDGNGSNSVSSGPTRFNLPNLSVYRSIAGSDLRLLSLIPAAIYTCDVEGRLTFYNEAAANLWMRRPELGRELWCGSHKIYRLDGSLLPLDQCPMAVTLKEGRPIHSREIIVERPDGSRRNVLPYPEPIRDETGRVLGAVNLLIDVTEQKRGEDALRRLAAIVESSDDAIVSKDLNGIIISWNRGAEILFGYPAEEMIGKSILKVIPPDKHDEEKTILSSIRAGRKINHYETIRVRKDGSFVEISLTVSPIKDNDGQVIGASKIARDITARKRNEQALREAREELARINADLEQRVAERTARLQETNHQLEIFVYTIAHDLRSPLRAMEACSQLLLDEYGQKLDARGHEYTHRIKNAALFLDKLLIDLLEYGRAARAEIELAPASVQIAWDAAVFQHQEQIRATGAHIEALTPLPIVRGHQGLLGQSLANLLSNALRFVAPGQCPHIRLRAETNPNTIRLWLEDNGIGIAPEHHQRIFRLFERLNGSTYHGTGTGLAIVREAITRMGGQLGLESTPGQGSRFWIELPKP